MISIKKNDYDFESIILTNLDNIFRDFIRIFPKLNLNCSSKEYFKKYAKKNLAKKNKKKDLKKKKNSLTVTVNNS